MIKLLLFQVDGMNEETDASWIALSAATKDVVRWLDTLPRKSAAEAEAPAAESREASRPTRAGAARSSARPALAELVAVSPAVTHLWSAFPFCGPNVFGFCATSPSVSLGASSRSDGHTDLAPSIAPRELYAPHAGAIGWGVGVIGPTRKAGQCHA